MIISSWNLANKLFVNLNQEPGLITFLYKIQK